MGSQPKQFGIIAPKAGKTQKIGQIIGKSRHARPGGVMSSKTGWVIYREVN
jgi:hypothetical protein